MTPALFESIRDATFAPFALRLLCGLTAAWLAAAAVALLLRRASAALRHRV